MDRTIFFLNGPTTNTYGMDPSGVYGAERFPQIEARCHRHAQTFGISLDFRQSNHEGVLIDWIQEARKKADGLIINGAGLTYTSIAVLDAESAIIVGHRSGTIATWVLASGRFGMSVLDGRGPLDVLSALGAPQNVLFVGTRAGGGAGNVATSRPSSRRSRQ